jgi:hypothetical protein
MATLTVQTTDLDGVVPSYVAAAGGGDEFPNDGRTMLHLKNGSGGAITVTVDALVDCDQGFNHDSVTSVGAGAEAMIGPFDIRVFNNQTTQRAAITYSDVTTLTIAAIKVA